MRNKKLKSLLCTLFLFSSITVIHADSQKVNFELTNGTTITYTLDQTPKITYGERTVTVTSSSGSFEYKMSEIKKVTMGNSAATSIGNTPINEDGFINNSNGAVNFSGFTAGSLVYIYSISGMMVETHTINADGSLSIDTNNLPTGTFIIKTKGSTHKFTKK